MDPSPAQCHSEAAAERHAFQIRGVVQGVGFRPFVYRMASELGLSGSVANSPEGAVIEVEGQPELLTAFRRRIIAETPPCGKVISIEMQRLTPLYDRAFQILDFAGYSVSDSVPQNSFILPDLGTCPDCLSELFDPLNRRYRYPFINCTNCGPRYSIIERQPYDRPNTTMRRFALCAQCLTEYADPSNRRFHAQPIACPDCGPQVELWNPIGKALANRQEALDLVEESLRCGLIVAIKGLGGFHLMVDARNGEAIDRLRKLKRRDAKPFAVMFPSRESLLRDCHADEHELKLLLSTESPIVLLEKTGSGVISTRVAPENRNLGALLPYTPLHHILMKDLNFPVVATSGNLSGEPICTDDKEALAKLTGVADLFLVHNRPILRPVDDSVARIFQGETQLLRRARGYAPLPLSISPKAPEGLVAYGAELKNSLAISTPEGVVVSQHIGDLESKAAIDSSVRVEKSLRSLIGASPTAVLCDLHPDYVTTRRAEKQGLPIFRVQHHLAHVLGCAAENEVEPPFLGVAWDGAGFGTDGTVWGGEFFKIERDTITHWATIRAMPLPGGNLGALEPRRSALGLLFEAFECQISGCSDLETFRAFESKELHALTKMLQSGVGIMRASSIGRLFDGVASLLGLCHFNRFEGEAAMAVEYVASENFPENYNLEIEKAEGITTPLIQVENPTLGLSKNLTSTGPPELIFDWRPMIREIADDLRASTLPSIIAAKFHSTLSGMVITAAELSGLTKVVLSGGCFLNKQLLNLTTERLKSSGKEVFISRLIPPGDGGISVGQIAAAEWLVKAGLWPNMEK